MADWMSFVNSIGQGAAEGSAAGPMGAFVGGLEGALQSAGNLISQIGKGRKEADILGPVQHELDNVLQAVVRTKLADPNLTVAQLTSLQVTVAQAYAKYDAFTRDPRFVDGRASRGGRDTMRPQIDGRNDAGQVVLATGGQLGELQTLIDARGGGGNYQLTPSGLIAGGAAAVSPISQNNLMLAGGAILAAKLLGLF